MHGSLDIALDYEQGVMKEKLINYINSKLSTKLTEEDIGLIEDVFKWKRIRKHQFLLQSGDVCKSAGFVVKGALKKYTIDETGKENIIELYLENWWAGDRESYTTGIPTPYFIEAVEDTELLVISKDDFENRLKNRSFFTEFYMPVAERQSYQLMKRLHTTKTMSASQKVEDLLKNYPEFFKRFPQHIIASYLGMTKETFSRIRSNGLKK